MRRCIIIGGARIENYDVHRQYLQPDDFFICCDCGLDHCEKLNINPDLIIGDFDSHADPHLAVETITLPHEKDDTDTVFAAKEAVKRGFDDFLLVGVTGLRLDHTLGNLYILLWLDSLGKRARIIDDYSEMEIVSDKPAKVSCRYPYFSLLNISGCAKGITVTGAKFPLKDAEITCDYQYGVSNEVLPDEEAVITIKEGKLLLIRVF